MFELLYFLIQALQPVLVPMQLCNCLDLGCSADMDYLDDGTRWNCYWEAFASNSLCKLSVLYR